MAEQETSEPLHPQPMKSTFVQRKTRATKKPQKGAFLNWRSERPISLYLAFSVRLKPKQYQGLRLHTLILPSLAITARNMGQMMGQIQWLDRSTA